MLIELIVLFIILLVLFYHWQTKNNDFFAKRGLPYAKPTFLFGNMASIFLRKKSFFDAVKDLYQECEKEKVYGIFEQRNPLLVIRDPDLIKEITVKSFDHFVNHRSLVDKDQASQDLFGSSLFMLHDAKWKDMRSILSPVFTGSKMRHMFDLIHQVVENMSTHLKQQVETQHEIELEVKELSTRFTNDIIASTAFGLQVDSFKNINNEFYQMGKKVTTIKGLQAIRFLLYNNIRFIVKLFKMHLFGKEAHDYFMNLVLNAIKYRKEHNIIRPDIINMLMEARGLIKSENSKHINREWTDVEIVAQCFLFFFAGFESSSVLMCFTLQELMENTETQQKLYEEIMEAHRQLEGKPLTYETLLSLKYMDMVISEVLRKWPPGIAADRVCNKDFEYVFDDGQHLEIKKGDVIWIPIVGFQRDPKYFSNPDKFDPERFSDENKDNIQPFTYMPFGLGPRNCIASRFALMEAKAFIYYIVRDFCIEVGQKTSLPLELSKDSFQINAKNGFWMKFKLRSTD